MRYVDYGHNPRIPIVLDMVASLTQADSAARIADEFVRAMQKAYGPRAYVGLSVRGLRPERYRITRLLTRDGRDWVQSVHPRDEEQSLSVHEEGFLAEIIATHQPKLIEGLHLEHDPVIGHALGDCRSAMAVPLFEGGQVADWAIAFSPEEAEFDDGDLEQFLMRANLLEVALTHIEVANRLREADRWIQGQIDRIAKIQKALLPQTMPDIPGLAVAASYETYDRAGGDYFDLLPLDPQPGRSQSDPYEPWAIVIADASGHGPAAAVVVAMLHAILHAYSGRPRGPGDVLGHLNRHLHADRVEFSFVTAFVGIYRPRERTLTYARAGHPPPILKGAHDGKGVRLLGAPGGIPLTVEAEVHYEEATIRLEPGQTLVLYTDGVSDAIDAKGVAFGIEGIERALTECAGEPECVVHTVHRALRRHEAGSQPRDDQTIVAMQVKPE